MTARDPAGELVAALEQVKTLADQASIRIRTGQARNGASALQKISLVAADAIRHHQGDDAAGSEAPAFRSNVTRMPWVDGPA